MEELGALGREQLATRHDLQLGFAKVERDMALLRQDVAERLEAQTRQLFFGMIGAMATISGIAFGAARLA